MRVSPEMVNAARYLAPMRVAMSMAAIEMTPGVGVVPVDGANLMSLFFGVVDDATHHRDRFLIGYCPSRSRPTASRRRRRRPESRWPHQRSRPGWAGALIIDSSIWVATITGLAHLRALSMMRFCTDGTCSG